MNNMNDNFFMTDRQFEMQTMDMFLNFDSGIFDDELDQSNVHLEGSSMLLKFLVYFIIKLIVFYDYR